MPVILISRISVAPISVLFARMTVLVLGLEVIKRRLLVMLFVHARLPNDGCVRGTLKVFEFDRFAQM